MASEGFHESADLLSPRTRDLHRAFVSLMEELEAVDWYQQRVDATGDPELKEILAHNRDEEKEHAAMVLEWIRRQDAGFDKNLREYLFTDGRIVALEAAAEGQGGRGDQSAASGNGEGQGGRGGQSATSGNGEGQRGRGGQSAASGNGEGQGGRGGQSATSGNGGPAVDAEFRGVGIGSLRRRK